MNGTNVGIVALFAVIGLLALASFAFWPWVLIDCLRKEPENTSEKSMWVLVIVLAGLLGALLHLIIRRPQRLRIVSK